jgi:ubiquinone/menaquinone biosynthesis C-methylase UbiE
MAGERNEHFWSDHAEVYDTEIDRVIGRDSREAIYDFLLGLRDLGNTVEFGCGPGFFTRAIVKNAGFVTATDISYAMLDRANANLTGVENVDFVRENCEHTTFPDDTFDTVFTANVVQILEHPEQALAEAYRILKPDGRLILLYYSFDSMEMFDRFIMMVRFMNRFHRVPYKRIISMDEIRAMAEKAGFRVEELKLIGGKVKAVYLLGRKPA